MITLVVIRLSLSLSYIFWWSAGSILQCERRCEPEMDWLGRDLCVESAGHSEGRINSLRRTALWYLPPIPEYQGRHRSEMMNLPLDAEPQCKLKGVTGILPKLLPPGAARCIVSPIS